MKQFIFPVLILATLLACQRDVQIRMKPQDKDLLPPEETWSPENSANALNQCQENLSKAGDGLVFVNPQLICPCLVSRIKKNYSFPDYANQADKLLSTQHRFYDLCYAETKTPSSLDGHIWGEPRIIEPIMADFGHYKLFKTAGDNAALFLTEDRNILWDKRFSDGQWQTKSVVSSRTIAANHFYIATSDTGMLAVWRNTEGLYAARQQNNRWLAPELVLPGETEGFYTAALGGDNQALIAAISSGGGGESLALLRQNQNEGWQKNSLPFSGKIEPRVYIDQHDREHLLWQEPGENLKKILYCELKAGSICANPQELATVKILAAGSSENFEDSVVITASANGDLLLTWWGDSTLSARFFSSQSNAWGSARKIGTITNISKLKVCLDRHSNGYAFWLQEGNALVSRLDNGGSWSVARKLPDFSEPYTSLNIDCNNQGLAMIMAGGQSKAVYFYDGENLVRDLVLDHSGKVLLHDHQGGFLFWMQADGPNRNAWIQEFRFSAP